MTKYDKARRLMRKRKVIVTKVNYNLIRAKVEGDTDIYECHFFRDGRYNCGCECCIRTGGNVICSHLLALTLHPIYRVWYPITLINGEAVIDEEAKEHMLDFSLPPHRSFK